MRTRALDIRGFFFGLSANGVRDAGYLRAHLPRVQPPSRVGRWQPEGRKRIKAAIRSKLAGVWKIIKRMQKNILITGASRGIGFHTARRLVYNGHRVLALARSESGLSQLQRDCEGMNGELSVAALPVGEVEAISEKVTHTLETLDILINNAAAFEKRALGTWTADQLSELYSVNVIAPVLLIQRLCSFMSKGGHVVNISSVGGVAGSTKFAGMLGYSSSKGALNIATQCLAEDLRPMNIRCNALALGSVGTEMFRKAFPGQEPGASVVEMARFIAEFSTTADRVINGKVVEVASSAV